MSNIKFVRRLEMLEEIYLAAKVAYSEISEAWEPTHVMLDGNWVGIDFFYSIEEGQSYACEHYREKF